MDSKNETIIIAQQLKMQFHSTRKEDRETIECYVMKLKSIADSLAVNNNPLSDPDLVLQLLAGLPDSPQYLSLKNTISSQLPLPNFSDACSMLYEHEKTTPLPPPPNPPPPVDENNSNSSKSTFEMIHDIASTVNTVASIAREFWNALEPLSGGRSSGPKPKPKPKPNPNPNPNPGNKKNGRSGGRGNNNNRGRGGGGGSSSRNSGRKQ